MIINKEKLPIQQFERIGISNSRIQKWPKDEMNNLLSGRTSEMKFLVFKDTTGAERKVNAKLSLYQMPDGTTRLKVHPYRAEIKNDLNLSKQELEKLKSGDTMIKTFNNSRYLVQLDASINELRKIRTDRITVPERLGKTQLSDEQKKALTEGKIIRITDARGKAQDIKIDLLNSRGFSKQLIPERKMSTSAAEEQNSIKTSYKKAESQSEYKMKR
jgi:hypothetical protein